MTLPGAIIIEGHVQGLSNTRSLGEAGIPVYVVDKKDCIARYSKYCIKFFRCPEFKSDSFADFLIILSEKENIKNWLLLPSNDHAVYTLSKHIVRLRDYYKMVIPSLDIVKNIYDKSLLLKIAERSNIPYPSTFRFNNLEEVKNCELPYPILTKGRTGLDFYKMLGKKAFLSRSLAELLQQLEKISGRIELKDTIAQEVIPFNESNKTISFTAFCCGGHIKTYWMGEKLREHPIRFGTATFCKSIFVDDLIKPSLVLIKELNYSGLCEIEYLKDPRDNIYKLIEINARTWLWVGLARASGIDFARIAYNYVNEIEINYPSNYKLNLKWSNFLTDCVYSFAAILTGKLTFKEFLTSYQGNVIHAVYDRKDVKPGFMYLWFLINFLKNR